MTMPQDVEETPRERSTEELRAEMFGILDELGTARADRAAALKAKFDALWKQISEDPERTVH